jgi:hypothetical protein
MTDESFTGMYELLDAVKAAILAADPATREALATTIDAYHGDCPEDFHWATGPQAPSLLYHLLMTIDCASTEKSEPKSRTFRLVDRKPEGRA